MLAKKQYNILLAAILGVLILNFLLIHSTIVGSCMLVIFIILASLSFNHRNTDCLFFGFLKTLSIVIITTSIAYLIFGLTTVSLLIILLLLGITSCIAYTPTSLMPHIISKIDLKKLTPIVLVWVVALIGFALLYTSRTAGAIVSPWIVVPKSFFTLFFLLVLSALVFIKNGTRVAPLIVPLFLLTVAVALVTYKIGYGFDQFVHESALRYIGEHGVITPRTLYYIGEYGLLIFISKFGFIPLGILNRFLLPVLFGTLIPLVVSRLCVPEGRTLRSSLLLLLFPLTPFIATTPQGLANLFLILLIFMGWLYLQKKIGFLLPILLMLATLFTHVIAGIPAVIFLAFIYLAKNKTLAVQTWLFIFAIGSLAIPALFAILSLVQPNLVQLGLHGNLLKFLGNLFDLGGRYNFWLDLAYLAKLIIPIFLFILVCFGLYKLKDEARPVVAFPYLALFGILLIDFLITFLFFNFPSLIFYEQSDFAARFSEMSFYFLIPFILLGGTQIFTRLASLDRFTHGVTITVIALFITSSIYLSYPRKDAYEVSHGFSTSSHDIAAVRAIEKNAGGDSYIVLANQAVGAAALHEFGFSRSYLKTPKGEVYFYSIPTGGELYKYYLQMVYNAPRAQIAHEAAQFAGVDAIYFVVNDYWWNAKKLIEIAKQEAKSFEEIKGGKIWIFRY